jgi:16S rRNA (guanine527-N7)-methyltransferase
MLVADIVETAHRASINLTVDQAMTFLQYRDMLIDWNARINLTSITDDSSILRLHFIDSMLPLRLIKEKSIGATTLIDVGTGAGFPGIPIKIALKNIDVTLLDSVAKKVNFCNELINKLELTNIRAIHARSEDFAHQPEHRERYDIVIARAVAPLQTLVEYLLPLTKIGGVCIAMKASSAETETEQARNAIQILGGKLNTIETVSLPDLPDKRALVLIDKISPTPAKYPRPAGAPRKSPLS